MNRVRELRIKRKLTLRELSEQVNMSFSNIASIERGEVYLKEDTAKLFADFFGVTIDYLLGNTDNPNAQIYTVLEKNGDIKQVEYELLDKIKGFTSDDFVKLNEYIDFLNSKKEGKNEK